MNREEAKKLLSVSRPDAAAANDPSLAEARALAEQDAELRKWFAAEQAADRVIAAKLKAAPLPPDLLEQVRAGTRARLAGRQRRRVLILALAASFAFLGVLAARWFDRRPTNPAGSFAACRTDLAQFLRTFPELDLATDRLPEVREWLSQQLPFLQANLPVALERFPTIGCRTVEWQGKKLALVCFMVEGQIVHLFVMPRAAFPDAPLDPAPTFAKIGPQTTAHWSSGESLYLVLTRANEALLRKVI